MFVVVLLANKPFFGHTGVLPIWFDFPIAIFIEQGGGEGAAGGWRGRGRGSLLPGAHSWQIDSASAPSLAAPPHVREQILVSVSIIYSHINHDTYFQTVEVVVEQPSLSGCLALAHTLALSLSTSIFLSWSLSVSVPLSPARTV